IVSGGAARGTVVYYAQVGSTDAPSVVTASDGVPERIRSCGFITNTRIVCIVTGMTQAASGTLLPFERRVAMDTNGQNMATLGQSQSFYDAYMRLSDGRILEWRSDSDSVLMERSHVPEAGMIGTRLTRIVAGLGVDRVDLRTLRATQVEPPNDRADGYITDGHGQVRIMSLYGMRGATGQVQSRIEFVYRREGSREWVPLGSYDTVTQEGIRPLGVDRETNSAWVLKKLNGRLALYRVKLDGSLAEELVYANERVDVDGVVTVNGGAKVIGVSFAE